MENKNESTINNQANTIQWRAKVLHQKFLKFIFALSP